jgi:hypothetical protein
MRLVIDRFTGYSMVLADGHQVMSACQFSTEELPMLFLLCERWPSMVTFDLLATALYPAPATLLTAGQIDDARILGTLEQVIAPIKQQIARYRQRLQVLGLEVAENVGYGYRLVGSRAADGCEEAGKTQPTARFLARIAYWTLRDNEAGRLILDDGRELHNGEMVEIMVGGNWIAGYVEQHQTGMARFVAVDGSVCGLCSGMHVGIHTLYPVAARDG